MRQSATDDVVRGVVLGEASLLTMNHDEGRRDLSDERTERD
jgi:hypothetical protein